MSPYDVDLDLFFELERTTTFRLSALLSDVQTVYNRVYPGMRVDISVAISRLSHAFLPPVVYQLEEYGIPRMISRKIQNSGLIDLETLDGGIHEMLTTFQMIGYEMLVESVPDLDAFDMYILRYFFEGIEYDAVG